MKIRHALTTLQVRNDGNDIPLWQGVEPFWSHGGGGAGTNFPEGAAGSQSGAGLLLSRFEGAPSVSKVGSFMLWTSTDATKEHFWFRKLIGVSGDTWSSWRRIWHQGDQGPGTGMDADTLDGQHASAFSTTGHTHSYLPLSGGTLTGALTINASGNGIRAASTASAATHFPVFTADPASTTRTVLTRTAAQVRSDIGAAAAADLSNYVTLGTTQSITGDKTFSGSLMLAGKTLYGGTRILNFNVSQATQADKWWRIATIDTTALVGTTQPLGGGQQNILLRLGINPNGTTGSNRGCITLVSITGNYFSAPVSIQVLDHVVYGLGMISQIRVSRKSTEPYAWYVDVFITNQTAAAVDNCRVELIDGLATLSSTVDPVIGTSPVTLTVATTFGHVGPHFGNLSEVSSGSAALRPLLLDSASDVVRQTTGTYFKGWLDYQPADLSWAVTTTTAQTISGAKTFSAMPTITGTAPTIEFLETGETGNLWRIAADANSLFLSLRDRAPERNFIGNPFWFKQTGEMQCLSYVSTATTGTAPFTVASTTAVTNLNADLLDGQHGSYFLNTSATAQTKSGALTVTGDLSTGGRVISTGSGNSLLSIGTAPTATVLSYIGQGLRVGGDLFVHAGVTTSAHKFRSLAAPEGGALINELRVVQEGGTAVGVLACNQFRSTATTGTAPFFVASTTAVTNLNADLVDGQHADYFLNTSGTTQNKTGIIGVGVSTGSVKLVPGTTTPDPERPGYVGFYTAEGTRRGYIGWSSVTNQLDIAGDGAWVWRFSATPLVGGSTMWHEGNDGSSSGLDADLLDGQHGSYFLNTSSTTQTKAGSLVLRGAAAADQVGLSIGPTLAGNTANAATLNLFTGGAGANYWHLVARGDTHATEPNRLSLYRYVSGGGANQGGVVHFNIDRSVTFEKLVTAERFSSTIATGTAPLSVTSTTKCSNLNADLLDDLDGSHYLNAVNGTLPASWDIGVTTAPNGAKAFLFNTYGDVLAFRTISDLEKWNGSAWVSYVNANIQAILTGDAQTIATVLAADRKFRFTFTTLNYLGAVTIVVRQLWNTTVSAVSSMLERWDGAAWVSAIPERTSSGGTSAYYFFNRGDASSASTIYRLTITGGHLTDPMSYSGIQLLSEYPRNGLPNNSLPITWDWQRNIVTTGAVTANRFLASSTTLCTSLNADLLDGQHGSYYLDTGATSQIKSGNLTVRGVLSNRSDTSGGRGFDIGSNASPPGNDRTAWLNLFTGATSHWYQVAVGANHATNPNMLQLFYSPDGVAFDRVWLIDPANRKVRFEVLPNFLDADFLHAGSAAQTKTGALTLNATGAVRALTVSTGEGATGQIASFTGNRDGQNNYVSFAHTAASVAWNLAMAPDGRFGLFRSAGNWALYANADETVTIPKDLTITANLLTRAPSTSSVSHIAVWTADPTSGHQTLRNITNAAFITALGLGVGGGIADAPDANHYVRTSGAWVNADTRYLLLSGGTITGGLTLSGLAADISTGSSSNRLLMREATTNILKPATATFVKGFLDYQAADLSWALNTSATTQTKSGALILGSGSATGSSKLVVGGELAASSGAVAQFNGFVRLDYLITHSASGLQPNTNNVGAVGGSAARYNKGWFTDFDISGNLHATGTITMGSGTRQMLNLWGTEYALGVQSATWYARSASRFSFFLGGVHENAENTPGSGGSAVLTFNNSEFKYKTHNVYHEGNPPPGGGGGSGPMPTYKSSVASVSITGTGEVQLATLSFTAKAGITYLITACNYFTKDSSTTVRRNTIRLRQGVDSSGTLLITTAAHSSSTASSLYNSGTLSFLLTPGAGVVNLWLSAANAASTTVTANNIELSVVELAGTTGSAIMTGWFTINSSGDVTGQSSGVTVTKPSTGYYQVTHNLGSTPSCVLATPVVSSFSTNSVTFSTYAHAANSFYINMNPGSTSTVSGFHFVIYQ